MPIKEKLNARIESWNDNHTHTQKNKSPYNDRHMLSFSNSHQILKYSPFVLKSSKATNTVAQVNKIIENKSIQYGLKNIYFSMMVCKFVALLLQLGERTI